MERGNSDVAAALLATERKRDSQPSESLPAGRTKAAPAIGAVDALPGRRRATRTQVQSLLEDQRRFTLRDGVASSQLSSSSVGGAFARLPDMFGQGALPITASTAPAPMSAALSTSAVVTTLQDAGLRWGVSSSSSAARGGAAGIRRGGVDDGDPISAPHVRRSWRLVEAAHRTAVLATSSPYLTANWSVGQRWVRADEVAQVNALAHAVWAESIMQPAREQAEPLPHVAEQTDTDRLYAAGLHMCFDSTHSTASLPVFLSAASSAVLARAEAEEVGEKSNAYGCQYSWPLPASGNRVLRSTSSLAFFTFTEAEYNAILLPPPPSTRFTYASSYYLVQLWARFGNPIVAVDRWRWSESGGNEDRVESDRWVPTVEELCAEYHRVTAGVLQRRRQQLRDTVQLQELRLQGEPSPAPPPTARATRGGGRWGTAAAVGQGSSAVAGCPSTAAASRHVHPFVASFDRYALLQHTATAVPVENAGAASAPLRRTLSSPTDKDSVPSASLPSLPPSSHGSSATIAAAASGDSGALALDAPSAPRPAGSTATAQERLTAQTTPSSWFTHDAEVHRRASLTRLLRQEQQTNVPYQQAANRYLALAAGAAVALQRAVFAFHNRDDEVDMAEVSGWKEEVQPGDSIDRATLAESSIYLDQSATSSRLPGRPPRGAFTVQLQPLPSVDPAAWRTAEVTVRKAAAEVLGTVISVTPAPGVRSPSGYPSRPATGVAVPLKRARSATMAQSTTNNRRKARIAVTKNDAEVVAAEVLEERNDCVDEVADSEAFAPSETASELGDNEQGHEGSVAGDEGDEGVKAEAKRGQRQRHQTRSSPTPQSSRPHRAVGAAVPHSQVLHLPVDATYAALQEYITDVLPFRCARLRGVVQAGWLLPAPPALPHALTGPIERDEVRTVDTQVRESAVADDSATRTFPSSAQSEKAPSAGDAAPAAHSSNSALLAPILTEEEYQELRKVSIAGVCNRVVSHTDEAVLLSLPPAVPRLHREVEQELERYLYEDPSALMEVNPVAQSLVSDIRVAYTQNKLLQRFAARLEHVLEGLKKGHPHSPWLEKGHNARHLVMRPPLLLAQRPAGRLDPTQWSPAAHLRCPSLPLLIARCLLSTSAAHRASYLQQEQQQYTPSSHGSVMPLCTRSPPSARPATRAENGELLERLVECIPRAPLCISTKMLYSLFTVDDAMNPVLFESPWSVSSSASKTTTTAVAAASASAAREKTVGSSACAPSSCTNRKVSAAPMSVSWKVLQRRRFLLECSRTLSELLLSIATENIADELLSSDNGRGSVRARGVYMSFDRLHVTVASSAEEAGRTFARMYPPLAPQERAQLDSNLAKVRCSATQTPSDTGGAESCEAGFRYADMCCPPHLARGLTHCTWTLSKIRKELSEFERRWCEIQKAFGSCSPRESVCCPGTYLPYFGDAFKPPPPPALPAVTARHHAAATSFSPSILASMLPTHFVPLEALMRQLPSGYTMEHVRCIFRDMMALEMVELAGVTYVRFYGGKDGDGFATKNPAEGVPLGRDVQAAADSSDWSSDFDIDDEMQAASAAVADVAASHSAVSQYMAAHEPDPYLFYSFLPRFHRPFQWISLYALVENAPPAVKAALLPLCQHSTLLYFAQQQHRMQFTAQKDGAVCLSFPPRRSLSAETTPLPRELAEVQRLLQDRGLVYVSEMEAGLSQRISDGAKRHIIAHFGTLRRFLYQHQGVFRLSIVPNASDRSSGTTTAAPLSAIPRASSAPLAEAATQEHTREEPHGVMAASMASSANTLSPPPPPMVPTHRGSGFAIEVPPLSADAANGAMSAAAPSAEKSTAALDANGFPRWLASVDLAVMCEGKAMLRYRSSLSSEERLQLPLPKRNRSTSQKIRRRIAVAANPNSPYTSSEVLLDTILRYLPPTKHIGLRNLLQALPPAITDFLPAEPIRLFRNAPTKVQLFEFRERNNLRLMRPGLPLPEGRLRSSYTIDELLHMLAAELPPGRSRSSVDLFGRLPYGARETIRLQHHHLVDLVEQYPQYFVVVYLDAKLAKKHLARIQLIQSPPPATTLSDDEWDAKGSLDSEETLRADAQKDRAVLMADLPLSLRGTLNLKPVP